MPTLPGTATLDPSRGAAATRALDTSTPTALWTRLSPAERQQFRGFLAPLLKIVQPLNTTEAWAWDAQWRGADPVPRVGYFQTSSGRGTTVEKRYMGSPEATLEVFDARDRLMCGDAGCNPPFQTWMGVQPDSRQQYCSPDTLVSVLFQYPRYKVARERLRSMVARLPGGFSFDVRNWPVERRNRYYALNPGTPGSPGYADRVKVQEADYYAQVNEVVASDPRAWAAWCAEADALSRMAAWATNTRLELLHNWIDPRRDIDGNDRPDISGRTVSGSALTSSSSYLASFTPLTDCFNKLRAHVPGELREFPYRAPRRWSINSAKLFSSHLWQTTAIERNLSRWLTHRYPLSATLYRRGKFDQGREGATDLPIREQSLRVPMDMRYFVADNTVPVPIWSQEGSERGFWGCFSGDAWGATPGENVAWHPTPGVASSLLVNLDESTADEYDRRTVSSLEVFFQSARRGGPFDQAPVCQRMVPLMYANPGARGSAVVRAPYVFAEQYSPILDPSGPRYRLDQPAPSEQWVVVPSPGLYVQMAHARALAVVDSTFEQFGKKGIDGWVNAYQMLADKRQLPAGTSVSAVRQQASLMFQGDLDGAASTLGVVGGVYAGILGLINGAAGAIAALLFTIINLVIVNLQDWKLVRGTNPPTLPMATARYIAADPAGAIRECDFSGTSGTYDDLIPQVRVVADALKSGNLDALKLFTELGKAVGSADVEEQKLPGPGGGPPRTPTSSGGPVVPLVGAALFAWLLMRGQK